MWYCAVWYENWGILCILAAEPTNLVFKIPFIVNILNAGLEQTESLAVTIYGLWDYW